MERIFSVMYGKKHIGKVILNRKGLYYHFFCRCILSHDNIYRLVVTCNKVQENLGVLVPQDGSFVLSTRIPLKRIGEGDMSFTVIADRECVVENFVQISPEEPFAYLSRLKESFLIRQNEQIGIRLLD